MGDGREITLSSPTDKVVMAVQAYAGELEREQTRSRTGRALEYRARTRRSTGGRIFGYEPARDPAGHATRVIVPAEALVINRLFALAAVGLGVKRIASTLNAESALAPRKAGRTAAWSPSTVRGVLGNALYRGTAEWGKSMKRDVWGHRRPSRRSAADVVRMDVPALRIVDEALWQRAHARRDASRAFYDAVVGAHGRAGGRPPSGKCQPLPALRARQLRVLQQLNVRPRARPAAYGPMGVHDPAPPRGGGVPQRARGPARRHGCRRA